MTLNTPTTNEYFSKLSNLHNEPFKNISKNFYRKTKQDSTEPKGSLDSFEKNFNPPPFSVPSEITERQATNKQTVNTTDQTMIDSYIANVGAPNFDLTSGVTVSKLYLTPEKIPVLKYEKASSGNPKDRSCILNIHGGGFVAGSVNQSDNLCRYLAEQGDFVVFNIDYRLAPEYSYKESTSDCYSVLKTIYENDDFSFDHDKFFVFGDSAGGNLSAVTTYQDTINDKYLTGSVLFYPVVELGNNHQNETNWPIQDYKVSQADQPMLHKIISGGNPKLSEIIKAYYSAGDDLNQPKLSPLNIPDATIKGMPPTLVVTCGFDSLRPQGEAYAKKLASNGVPTHYICYSGMEHAFLDKLGIFPQAQDALHETIDWISELTKK